MESQSTILEWITAISSLVTPILVVILSVLFAGVRRRQDRLHDLQQQLQDDRIAVYNTILEPHILMATPDQVLHKEKKYRGKSSGDVAADRVMTREYKAAEFKLFLMGSDDVVRAYDRLMQFYRSEKLDGREDSTKQLVKLMSELILEIRKSVGNEKTNITYRHAARWFVKDADKFF